MKYSRIIVTACNDRWVDAAIAEFCGYGSSVIGCDAEVGLEKRIPETETIDGRHGASLLVFGFSKDAVQTAITNRTGQCLMTCPTTAVFDGLAEQGYDNQHPTGEETKIRSKHETIPLGKHLRFFGKDKQKSKR